jgi:hypothetical protein
MEDSSQELLAKTAGSAATSDDVSEAALVGGYGALDLPALTVSPPWKVTGQVAPHRTAN